MHPKRLRNTALAVALAVGVGSLTSCAKITEDPVNCGVIGSVVGGAIGVAIAVGASSDNVAGPAILGTTLGASLGALAGYKICKYPTVESAEKRARKRRIETSPAETKAEEPAEETPSE